MNGDELFAALLAELKEYGEVLLTDDELVEAAPDHLTLTRRLSEALLEVLSVTYDMQRMGFLIRRVGEREYRQSPFDMHEGAYRSGFENRGFYGYGFESRQQRPRYYTTTNPGGQGSTYSTTGWSKTAEAAKKADEEFRKLNEEFLKRRGNQ